MLKFNNTHLFTGYIKQLLKDFNLPKFKVYTREQQEYFEKYGKELNVIGTVPRKQDTMEVDSSNTILGSKSNYDDHMKYVPYIRNGMIQEYIDGEWIDVGSYIKNDKVVVGKRGAEFVYENTAKQLNEQHKTEFTYGVEYLNYTKNLIIKDNVYDSYTHEYLGDYLRFLRDYNGLDLMSLYNCFSNRVCEKIKLTGTAKYSSFEYKLKYDVAADIPKDTDIKNLYFKNSGSDKYLSIVDYYDCDFVNKAKISEEEQTRLNDVLEELQQLLNSEEITIYEKLKTKEEAGNTFTFDSDNSAYKLYLIPVKLFNKYTIAIDSALPIEMCCVMYGDYQDKRTKFATSSLNLAEHTYTSVSQSHFSAPFIYDKIKVLTNEVLATNSAAEIAQNEDDLRLLLKVPVNNTSTIIILEGDYRNWNDIKYTSKTIEGKLIESCSKNKTVVNIDNISKYEQPKLISELQLLRMNIKEQVPFANRLIEYLSGNVITSQEDIKDNIERAQTVMLASHRKLLTTPNDSWTPGIWTDQMRILAYEYVQNNLNNSDTNRDVLGYIDKDVEKNYTQKYKNGTTTISNVDIYQEENMWRRLVNGKY